MKKSKEESSNSISLQELVENGSITPFSTPKGEFYCTINTGGVNKNCILSSPSFRVCLSQYIRNILTRLFLIYSSNICLKN